MHNRNLSECRECNSNREHELLCKVEDLRSALKEAMRLMRHSCHGSFGRCGRCDGDERRLSEIAGESDGKAS